jgi:hypothetical protein
MSYVRAPYGYFFLHPSNIGIEMQKKIKIQLVGCNFKSEME